MTSRGKKVFVTIREIVSASIVACLLKVPSGTEKGVVTFTTQERDRFIRPFTVFRNAVESLKKGWVVGLHHNWHDHRFQYDPLFDFSMAGEGD